MLVSHFFSRIFSFKGQNPLIEAYWHDSCFKQREVSMSDPYWLKGTHMERLDPFLLDALF